jgi:hypothetical protein
MVPCSSSHLPSGNAFKATLYVARDIAFTALLFKYASSIDSWAQHDFGSIIITGWQKSLVKAVLWLNYWWFQGLVWAGIFCLGTTASFDNPILLIFQQVTMLATAHFLTLTRLTTSSALFSTLYAASLLV